MLNLYKSLNIRLHTALTVTCLIVGAVFSSGASASCGWSGASPSYGANSPIIFEAAGYKMLANKKWYEDSRYPVGSLMGVSTVMLKARSCTGLVELKDLQVDVVYAPPMNATPSGAGYRIPTSSPGVSIDIEFPNGVRRNSEIVLATSDGVVSSGGIMTVNGSQIPAVAVRLSVVKTGSFTEDDKLASIRVDGGLGTFRYYSSGDPSLMSMSTDQLQMPTKYHSATAGDYLGDAVAPSCKVGKLGDVSLVTGAKIISLPSVNSSDFSGIGSIEAGSKAQHFSFTCDGTSNTKPVVSFEATFPYKAGVDGVGMPALNSDVGIQVLFNGSPVKFGADSPVLGWNVTPLDGALTDIFYGVLGSRGYYCKSGCGTDMAGANWVDGGAGSGNNDLLDAEVTFKYYQTTDKAPVPESFSVPFTISLDVQ